MGKSILDWPDLAFHHYCLKVYHLNRGVYNAIDQWLFERGCVSIRQRRQLMLDFLDQAAREANGKKHLTFGKGKLAEELTRFMAARRGRNIG